MLVKNICKSSDTEKYVYELKDNKMCIRDSGSTVVLVLCLTAIEVRLIRLNTKQNIIYIFICFINGNGDKIDREH